MTRHEEKPRERQDKQKYEAPEVRSEEVFETLALVCTKADTQCPVEVGEPPGVARS